MNLNRCCIVYLFVTFTFWLPLPAFVRADDPPPGEQRKFVLPELKVEKYSLTNGLTVILHEDHKTPLVAVNVVYKVGSKDDPPGRGGLAHLFEHLMCEGSQHSDEAFANAVNEFQCDVNAKTGRDRTFYYETVTTNALERVLWLEADRMGFLLPALTREKLDAVRNVVKNERRSRFDNVPFGAAEGVILGELYPAGNPYQHLMIGSMADLSASQLADVSAFGTRHYAPNNACLCLAGDFQTAQAKRWIEKYFGPLRRGVEIAPAKPNVPRLTKARHLTLTDRVNHARAQLVWPTVPADHPDEAALDVLASVLGGLSNENRLYRRLVHDQHLAIVADASHPTFLLSGEFWVNLIAQPGQSLAELVRLTDAEIQRLKNEGPASVEVSRAQIDRERSTIKELESVAGKADVLCRDVAATGDPRWSLTAVEKVFAVTSEDVQRVARRYLGPCRIEVDVVPGARAVQTPDVEAAPGEKVAPVNPPAPPIGDVFDDSIAPVLGPTPRFTAPPFQRQKLSNGLKLRIVERLGVPLVTLVLIVHSGETSTPSGKEGLCKITASLLDEGTTSRTALQIAGELADIGGTLSADGFLEATNIEMTTLTRQLDRALDLYADVIMNPSFTEKAVQRVKLEREAELDGGRTIDTIISDRVFDRLIYPHGHVYARPYLGTIRSTRSITRDDAVGFYRKSFVPGNAELVIVGDVQMERIVAALEARLGAWRPGPLPSLPRVPDHVPPANQPLYLIDLPGATQSVVTVGRAGLSAKSPDREALAALNTNLGARINWIIRDDKGYSYGIEARFPFRIGPAPCVWTGSVQTSATKDALVVLMDEMNGITGPKAITEEELTQMAARIPIGLGQFETDRGITDQIWYLVTYNLGDDYYDKKFDDFNFVSKVDVDRVAKDYLKPELMTILVVGDRSKIEGPLRSIPFVKSIRFLDTEGNPMPESAAMKSAVK